MFSDTKTLHDGSKLTAVRKAGTRVTYNHTPANSTAATSSVRTKCGSTWEAEDALIAAGKVPERSFEEWRRDAAAKVGKPIGFSSNDDPQYEKEKPNGK